MTRRPMTRTAARLSLPALCLLLLAGCGTSPPTRFHLLARPDADSLPAPGEARVLVELLPVAVPEGLARSNLVLTDDTRQVSVLESERWLAPIADDLRQILADSLWRMARAADTYQAPVPVGPSAGPPRYRLAVRLDRFEAVPGRTTTVEGSWTLRRLPSGAAHGCRWAVRLPVGGLDATAAAAALAAASRQLADQVGGSLHRAVAGQADVCTGNGA